MDKLKIVRIGIVLNVVYWLSLLIFRVTTLGFSTFDIAIASEVAIYIALCFGMRARSKLAYVFAFVITIFNMFAGLADLVGVFEIVYLFIGLITIILLMQAKSLFFRSK